MKILAVDDDPIFLELLMVTLAGLDYNDVHFAVSGLNALELIEQHSHPFDCILLDIRMEPMDGIELCRRIRAMPDYRQTPIVMVTAMSEKNYIDQAFGAGANDYVTKPIDRIEIKVRLNMVSTLLGERSHVDALAEHIVSSESAMDSLYKFEDAIPLSDASELTSYTSMENYVLKLGNLRLFSSAALGFHIENANDIFAFSPMVDFLDMLEDVAEAISEALKHESHLLSYAGRGDFVAIVPRVQAKDRTELEFGIQQAIEESAKSFHGVEVSPPRVRVGKPKSGGLLSFGSPTDTLTAAIESARSGALPFVQARTKPQSLTA